MTWELLDKPGEPPQAFSLERESAIELFNAAIAAATKANLPWDVEPIVLTPSKQLVQLVRKSQELAVGESDES
jgi:CRISPR-associated protein Csb1